MMVSGPAAGTADPPVVEAVRLAGRLVDAWGSWGPTMTVDARRIAFLSDRGGVPEVWVQDLRVGVPPPDAHRVKLSDDPVVAVHWSADDAWLACAVATDGGVRTQVWVVRPDGTDARRIAGSRSVHAELGPWTRSGHHVVVTLPSPVSGESTRSFLADPVTGELLPLAVGDLISVLDLSVEERLVILRDGRRGQQFCVVVDRVADAEHPLIPGAEVGATDAALLRPAPEGTEAPLVAYVVTEAGFPRRRLLSMPLGPNGLRGEVRLLAARDDAEVESVDADDAGRLLLIVWNVGGRSEFELLETAGGSRITVPVPGAVALNPVLSRDGRCVVVTVEGPDRPRELWRLDTATHGWSRATAVPQLPEVSLVEPTLESFRAADGLELTGWLYRVPGRRTSGPAVLHLHGGPEAQERPTFSPEHQAMVAAGIAVFAPNIRGSSGFGRAFVHADDVHRRYDAFQDVLDSADFLVSAGIADPARIAVTGRSYGGYLTLATLAFSPGRFAAGIDVCGMSDLRSFYRNTEPWIASAAFSKYGAPSHDRKLLRDISPLRKAENIHVPLLVAHGELDTNVPVTEAHQIVSALRRRGRPVEYLELPGEGHEYRRAASRRRLIEAMVMFLSKHL